MFEANEFTKVQDKINKDGTNFIIMGLPKKTYTMLDIIRFVPKIFQKKIVNQKLKDHTQICYIYLFIELILNI